MSTPVMDIETIWCRASALAGDYAGPRFRRRPSPGMTAVLLTLLNYTESIHGMEIARRAEQDQPMVTARLLPRLLHMGFVEECQPRYRRVAREWRLTPAGRAFAELLRDER